MIVPASGALGAASAVFPTWMVQTHNNPASRGARQANVRRFANEEADASQPPWGSKVLPIGCGPRAAPSPAPGPYPCATH
jgi:hypothetical protein